MMIQHPFQWLSTSQQKLAFAALLVLIFLLAVGMNALSRHLKTDVAPRGIVSFELAGELSLAQRMVESWGRPGQIRAGISLGLDYLFLFAYSSTIALACVSGGLPRPARRRPGLGAVWCRLARRPGELCPHPGLAWVPG